MAMDELFGQSGVLSRFVFIMISDGALGLRLGTHAYMTGPRVSILLIDMDGHPWICMIRGCDAK